MADPLSNLRLEALRAELEKHGGVAIALAKSPEDDKLRMGLVVLNDGTLESIFDVENVYPPETFIWLEQLNISSDKARSLIEGGSAGDVIDVAEHNIRQSGGVNMSGFQQGKALWNEGTMGVLQLSQ